ncbi:MAG: DNA mismatch repair endonuclease MutL [Lachnospiraceae bacterium]|nr:DNA mismatch repair endonuclease MutL [Lachnospiraceae bacterium]
MSQIQVLDQITIDKIAAGEVIERPASIVKELVENAIDAGGTNILIEIEGGGITLIRISDNGHGIAKADVAKAFLRHSTSKIRQVEDLNVIQTLGFRGEALSSIAAVAKVELITKQKDELMGTNYKIEGAQEVSLEDAAAPDGTTFFIRQLFYNVPARKKFLKSATTEGGHVQDLLIRLALSHPEIAFTFIHNKQEKLRTAGNGKLKDVIYALYGREVANHLLEVNYVKEGFGIKGFLGKPEINRGNRSYETFFVNGRYIKSAMISKSIEDGYKNFVMQHKFPFVVLHFTIDGEQVDVNVHPTKMELRFQNHQEVFQNIYDCVHQTLLEPELIPKVELPTPSKGKKEMSESHVTKESSSPFLLRPQSNRTTMSPTIQQADTLQEKGEAYFITKMRERVHQYYDKREDTSNEQLHLIEAGLLKGVHKPNYRLIGQVFDTYWLVAFQESLYIIDQHAAHEKVLYERTLKDLKTREHTSQQISPPIILKLHMSEANLLETYLSSFTRIGFEIDSFGGEEYAVRAVPGNLFSLAKKELLIEMLDALAAGIHSNMAVDLVDEKIASISCRAAVKGNQRLSGAEVDQLMEELLTLENPYFCPHGRPTIISFTKRELEKKFKRIV